MKNTCTLLFIITMLLAANLISSQELSWQYAHAFGGSSGSDLSPNNKAYNLIADDYGNAYVFGTYGPFTTFNDSLLQFFSDGSRGSFIVKYNCAGGVEWFKAISNAEQYNDQGSHMILKDNYLYLMGTTHVDMGFRTWFLDTTINGASLYPPYTYPWQPTSYTYIIKMDTQGNIVDYHLMNLEMTRLSKANSLWMDWTDKRGFTIDNDGNYYIPVRFSSDYSHRLYCDNNFIMDYAEQDIAGNGGYYIPHLLKFDSDFNFVWCKPFFSHTSDARIGSVYFNISDMYCSSDNNIYMTGYLDYFEQVYSDVFPLDIYFNEQQSVRLDHNNNQVGYILKMNNNGDILWCRQSKGFILEEGSFSLSNFETLTVDEASNNIYISGYATQYNILNPYLPPNVGAIVGDNDTIKGYFPNSGSSIGIIVNYNIDGNYKRVITPVANSGEISRARLYNNRIYALVSWRLTLEHGASTYNYAIGNAGLTLCTWDMEGNPANSIDIASSGNMYLTPQELSINSMGEVVVAGNFDDNLVFGGHSINTQGSPKYMFIAKYGNACVLEGESSGEFCYGDTYLGRVLTHSGDYVFNLESSIPGVDSVHTLHAVVQPKLLTGINDTTVCIGESFTLVSVSGYDSYLWSTGSQANTETLQFEAIGDYTVYVSLTDGACGGVDQIEISAEDCTKVYSEVSLSFCHGDSYHGLVLDISGDYEVIIPSSTAGIDSVITLHASVSPEILSGLVSDTIICTDTELILEAALGYDSYLWSTGSQDNTEVLSFTEEGDYVVSVAIARGNCSVTDSVNITAYACIGVNKTESKLNISVYPNPVDDVCTVDIGEYKLERVVIFDMYGKKIAEHKELSFPTADLVPGMYIVEVHVAGGKTERVKISSR